MREATRRLATALTALIALSGVWLTWVSADASSRYRDDPRDPRTFAASYLPGAGRILTADGVVVAADGDTGRRYPEGARYAHLVGHYAAASRSGIEESRYATLRVRDDGSIRSWLLGLGGGGEPHDVILTVDDRIQRAAHAALDGRPGAVVLIEVATGRVLAYVSGPGYDPNRVVAGDLDLREVPERGLDRVADRVLPPGSTFKVIVAAAALGAGLAPDTEFPDAEEYLAPGSGAPIGNAGDGFCGDGDTLTLTEALAVSCNTVFARLAVDLGGSTITAAARRAGFESVLPWETGAVRSSLADGDLLATDPGALAQTGIGERDVRATPLLMALIAAAVGNDGIAMQPTPVNAVVTAAGDPVSTTSPRVLARFFPEAVAADLLEMMARVVSEGTGGGADVDGLLVWGKTGTAEGSGGPHAWFIGLAGRDDPEVAIAILVESAGSGGRVAAPIARQVFSAWRSTTEG